jgi:hypothetical protein
MKQSEEMQLLWEISTITPVFTWIEYTTIRSPLAQVFLNGALVLGFWKVSMTRSWVVNWVPRWIPVMFCLSNIAPYAFLWKVSSKASQKHRELWTHWAHGTYDTAVCYLFLKNCFLRLWNLICSLFSLCPST